MKEWLEFIRWIRLLQVSQQQVPSTMHDLICCMSDGAAADTQLVVSVTLLVQLHKLLWHLQHCCMIVFVPQTAVACNWQLWSSSAGCGFSVHAASPFVSS